MAAPRLFCMVEGVKHWACSRCKNFKPVEAFYSYGHLPSSACKACLQTENSKRDAARRQAARSRKQRVQDVLQGVMLVTSPESAQLAFNHMRAPAGVGVLMGMRA